MPRGRRRSQIRIVQCRVCRTQDERHGRAGNPVTVAQWAECEIYVGPESSAEGLLKLLTKGRFIYIEASDKVEAWIDKNNQVRSRILYRVTNFQV